jgi:hypothetical protein
MNKRRLIVVKNAIPAEVETVPEQIGSESRVVTFTFMEQDVAGIVLEME